MSDRSRIGRHHRQGGGRYGLLLAFCVQFFAFCSCQLRRLQSSCQSGNKKAWISKEKEKEKEKEKKEKENPRGKHLLLLGPAAAVGCCCCCCCSISRRQAGMFAAVVLIGSLSLIAIFVNASLISEHLRTSVVLYRPYRTSKLDAKSQERGDGDARGASSRGIKLQRASPPPKLPKLTFPRRIEADKHASSSSSSSSSSASSSASDSVLHNPHPCEGFKIPPPPTDKKRTGPRPCPVCYLPEVMAIKEMPEEHRYVSPVLKHLSYVSDDDDLGARWAAGQGAAAGSAFGGYRTLEEREESFNIRDSMRVHCGFVKGSTPGVGTGYDIDEDDRLEMYACQGVVVASAIFGNYDQLQQPKNMSEQAKKSVCFFMFVDEETETSLEDNDSFLSTKRVGLWRIVVVHNLPYKDARRNGKVPKLLLHRLFPNARFSLWLDGKLELVVDPYKILERFLWRTNETFAISQHYKRFDVFMEAEANKVAAKYDNASIDAQIEFYQSEGLTPYSLAKLPITSDVPEGCVIVREHTPIANLFSCLWFNEVDRFTPRDQISFGIVRDKLAAKVPWQINMFKDCERRNFVVQGYHKDLLQH